jgi:hypothetical protein
MPVFLDTRGLTSVAIAVCDRCKMKVPFVTLVQDTNFPGLRVCAERGCRDQLDPYRLPARKTERINLRFPRPDVSVAADDNYLVTGSESMDGSSQFFISTEQNTQVPTETGNKDTIAPNPPDNTST